VQPKYGLKSRHIEGAEALIRWNSKEFGFIYPDEFIPLCEKNGFVVELDFFILEEVCKAMRRWIDDGKTPVVISVNQSRLHLNYDDFIWRLREIVDKYEIPYEYIELELTESVFTENAEQLIKVMQKLHEIGFKLSIDDFGSGYSSLNMLKDIPADVVKIDREFFNGTVNSEKGRAVISTVVDLAKNLNMEVISEGVETVEQVEFLSGIDCAMVQGFYFAKPMTIEAFEKMWYADLELIEQEKEAEEDFMDGIDGMDNAIVESADEIDVVEKHDAGAEP
jgi:EAL domain-containing protein (putative c-di-GMP-specific phosphodiesterase class I)